MAQSDAHSPPESSDEEGSSNRQTESGYGKRDGSTDQIEQSAVLSSSGEKGPESEKPESEIRESQRGKISGIAVGDLTTDEASVVERVLDSAYEYVAINTAHPKLPGRLPFSLTVQVLRCLRGMTQHQLAQASDVKQCYVSMIEKEQGKVPDEAVRRIKRFLELPDETCESAPTDRTVDKQIDPEVANA